MVIDYLLRSDPQPYRNMLAATRRRSTTTQHWFAGSREFISKLREGEPRSNFQGKLGRSYEAILEDRDLLKAEYGENVYVAHVTIKHKIGAVRQANGFYKVGNADIVQKIHDIQKL